MYKNVLKENPELEEILQNILREVQQAKRPADETILDDVDLREFLKISKRTCASLREKRLITYSKIGGKIYYRLEDVLKYIAKNRVEAIDDSLKIK